MPAPSSGRRGSAELGTQQTPRVRRAPQPESLPLSCAQQRGFGEQPLLRELLGISLQLPSVRLSVWKPLLQVKTSRASPRGCSQEGFALSRGGAGCSLNLQLALAGLEIVKRFWCKAKNDGLSAGARNLGPRLMLPEP